MAFKGLSGKVAIVTGAASGIGAATAARLVEEGCKVVGVDQHAIASKGNLHGVIADVSTEAGTDAYVTAAVKQFGGVDLLVNNAAHHGAKKPLAEITPAAFDLTMAINARGVFLGMRAVIHQMLKQNRGGSIVSVASVGGLRSFPDLADYGASKRAVIGLSGAAAVDYGKHGIRSNVVCPAHRYADVAGGLQSAAGNDGRTIGAGLRQSGHRAHRPPRRSRGHDRLLAQR